MVLDSTDICRASTEYLCLLILMISCLNSVKLEIKRTTKQKIARRRNKERENHLEQESSRQKTMMEGYILQWTDKAQVKRPKR